MEMIQFLNKLAASTPTPGGGSASALAGALSASLVVMVARLSAKRGKLQKQALSQIEKQALRIQKRLYLAVDRDAKSYDAVMKAFRLPKSTERERRLRSAMIQKAYRKATVIPQMVSEDSLALLELSRILLLKGNPNARSDVGVAVYLANAAFEGGLLNVEINLEMIQDEEFRTEKLRALRRLSRKRDQLIIRISKLIRTTKQSPT